jgi:hypothetical protein
MYPSAGVALDNDGDVVDEEDEDDEGGDSFRRLTPLTFADRIIGPPESSRYIFISM